MAGEGRYLIKVDVKYADPGMPNFEDMEDIGVKVSDIEFDESSGGYIAFSKVGLEVPVVEKFYKENQRKLKELYRFNESYDIFKNLETIQINVFLSDELSETLVGSIKKVVENLKFPFGEIEPTFQFEVLPLTAGVTNKSGGITARDLLMFLSRFGNAIGLILATILLGLAAYFLMKKYWELKAAAEEEPEKETIEEDGFEDRDEMDAVEDELSDAESDQLNELYSTSAKQDFERFRLYYTNSPKETSLLLKRWINLSDSHSKMALRAVAQQLNDDELMNVFHGLENEEREKWKSCLDTFLEEEQIISANRFISEEVMRDLIAPPFIRDFELVNMLLGIDLPSACQFVRENPDDSKILLNLLTPQFVGKILDDLSAHEAEVAIANSLRFDFSQITDDFASFKRTMTIFWSKVKSKPFNQKLLQMLPDFNPSKELMVYEFLAKSKMRDEMAEVASDYFPSELISSLPKELLRNAMQSYPNDKKIQLLFSCGASVRNSLIESFAEEGSASREMVDMEFANLEADDLAKARIKNSKDEIWKEFLNFMRNMIKSNENYRSEVENIVSGWITQMIQRNGNSGNDSARSA